MFVSLIAARHGTDQDLCLVIAAHMSPEILFCRKSAATLLTPKLFLVSIFFSDRFLPVDCCLLLHFSLNHLS